MCFSNLVTISPTGQLCPITSVTGSPAYKATSTIGEWPTYTRQQLLAIKDMIKLDSRYSKIPFKTIQLVRKYKINKRPRKLDLKCKPVNQTRCNTKNLVKIDITNNDKVVTNNLRIATVNTRSIKNKVELVLENSELDNIDILAVTATWLTDTNDDQAWIKTSGLQDQNFTFHSHCRIGRRGGELGLQHRSEYQSKKINHNPNYITLE